MIANSAASEGCSRWQAGFAPLSFYVMPHEALLVHRRLVAALHLDLVSIGFTMAPHGNHRSGESPAQARGRLSDPAVWVWDGKSLAAEYWHLLAHWGMNGERR
ncbi:MAG: hypothetical protein V5B40_06075 [Candidatus Accumulibacter meliphilus]|jgi:hypothetical protein|uniref:hypothetical protein n=1 Tax=Candidatus Accumulibacter meliphilus TaxID=2211374 RepID=UPI002FC3D34C